MPMLPDFDEGGYLPYGVHAATQEEFEARFVIFNVSDRRFRLYERLKRLVEEANKSRIVKRVIVAGSFVTAKPEPNDFDCVLVLDASVVGQELRPFEYNLVSRKMARHVFGGDIVPVIERSSALDEYLEFFQTARNGQRVGVVEIRQW
jgi:predicted nucleic acid-binding OB-fold protein